jgi:hypothetical protein
MWNWSSLDAPAKTMVFGFSASVAEVEEMFKDQA